MFGRPSLDVEDIMLRKDRDQDPLPSQIQRIPRRGIAWKDLGTRVPVLQTKLQEANGIWRYNFDVNATDNSGCVTSFTLNRFVKHAVQALFSDFFLWMHSLRDGWASWPSGFFK